MTVPDIARWVFNLGLIWFLWRMAVELFDFIWRHLGLPINKAINFIFKRPAKMAHNFKLFIGQIDHRLKWDGDILTEKDRLYLLSLKEQLNNGLKEHSSLDLDKSHDLLTATFENFQRSIPSHRKGMMREFIEMFVIVCGVVGGARALFIQPFKIPTGSMQPTLFGINFTMIDEPLNINLFERALSYVDYSYRYVDIVIKEDGYIDFSKIKTRNPFFFFPYTGKQQQTR
jgi:signal peptidase I